MQFKFNIPNKITLIRVSLVPLFALILLVDIPYKNQLAAFVFAMLSISDFLDGYFARKKKQITDFGKLIDPIADKLLISTALIFLIGKGVDLWMTVAIILREVIVTAVRIYLLPMKIVVPASNFGKAKTVVQSLAIVFVLLQFPLSWHMMLVAVLLTVGSGIEYIIRIKIMTGNKIVNLPNVITLCRFLLIIPLVYYLINSKAGIALLIFAIITLSDKLDGISARLMNQKTELGSGLDSFTDWTLIMVTFFVFVIKGRLEPFWVILLIIPSIISGIAKIEYAKKVKAVPVSFIARLSVGVIYVTIMLILINFEYNINFGYENYLLTAAVVLVYATMIGYLFKVPTVPKKALKKKIFVAKNKIKSVS